MSLEITLSDNSKHSVNDKFTEVSASFKDKAVIDMDLKVFLKIKEFIDYFILLDISNKKLFDVPEKIIENNAEIYKWVEKYLETSNHMLVEVINESHKHNIKPLMNLACYKLANIIENTQYDKIKDIFSINDDNDLKKEFDWNFR